MSALQQAVADLVIKATQAAEAAGKGGDGKGKGHGKGGKGGKP